MTNEEASFCMKQYLPDSDSLECMKCPYYHTIPIEGTENGFTCKADEAHKMAINALETIPKYKDAYGKGWVDGAKASYEHLKMCEEEQDPCEVEGYKLQQAYNKGFEDCRQAVLDLLFNSYIKTELTSIGYASKEYAELCVDELNELPSVNPQPICEEREKGECPYYAG